MVLICIIMIRTLMNFLHIIYDQNVQVGLVSLDTVPVRAVPAPSSRTSNLNTSDSGLYHTAISGIGRVVPIARASPTLKGTRSVP